MRYNLAMLRSGITILFLLIFAMPTIVAAQFFSPLNQQIQINSNVPGPTGQVTIMAEGLTYKPSFYRGRAEPTTGNSVRVIAIPEGQNPNNFTYRWSIDGRPLADTGPVAIFTNPYSKEARVGVSVVDNSGNLFARKEETIRLSSPEVVFYEENLLRGHGAAAITNTHTLIGEEGVVRAEPYFMGLGVDPTTYKVAWEVNGNEVQYGNDWRELVIQRPEEPLSNYLVNFSAVNKNNLAERVERAFNLNFGL